MEMENKALETIQTKENLNVIYPFGDKDNGEAYHKYYVFSVNDKDKSPEHSVLFVGFQNGARNSPDSVAGVLDCDLLEIVRHRLQCFQGNEYASKENDHALTHIEEALMWMNRRVEDRIRRGVLGTMNK